MKIEREIRRVLRFGGLVMVSWQPRMAKAEAMVQEMANDVMQQLRGAGFRQVRLKTKPMKPVTCFCAMGVK